VTRRQTTIPYASPLLVGAVTTLLTIVAVFISYNANQGLPFVPAYKLTVNVPDASGLVAGNEVRIGGKRVGIIEAIDADEHEDRAPTAVLSLKLEEQAGPLRADSRITVRPLSPLGLKYLEVLPGKRGKPVRQGGRLSLRQSPETVDLDQVLNAFDDETRRALQVGIDNLGTGLGGRGPALNRTLGETAPLLRRLEPVARNVSDPRTRFDRFFPGLESTVSELDAARRQLGSLVVGADTTVGALDSVRGELGQTLDELPPTQTAGIRALRTARPVLRDAETFLREARPGLRALPSAARRLDAALDTGVPVLRRAVALAGRLETTLRAVEALARDDATRATLRLLRTALLSAGPTVDFVAPAQTRCNYLGLWTRNVPSVVSEGDDAGTWFRTLVVAKADEALPSEGPAPDLHENTYGHTGAPGQDGECEIGNEPYLPGQRIGRVPGHQGGGTQDTTPPPGVGVP
jgi:ABC-type transporter Mla subunit MlaD